MFKSAHELSDKLGWALTVNEVFVHCLPYVIAESYQGRIALALLKMDDGVLRQAVVAFRRCPLLVTSHLFACREFIMNEFQEMDLRT